MRTRALLVVVVVVVVVAAVAWSACTGSVDRYGGTVTPPGDPAHFAGVNAVASAIAFAGGGSLVSMELDGVRADGTLDLNASYGAYANYEVQAPASSPPDKPVGAGGFAGPGHRRVSIDVRQPGSMVSETVGESTTSYTNRGMSKRADTPEAGPVVGVRVPSCQPAALWQIAAAHGAPANAVAQIRWDGREYAFAIIGTPLQLRFTASCALAANGASANLVAPAPAVQPTQPH